jgi:hypothetical protein
MAKYYGAAAATMEAAKAFRRLKAAPDPEGCACRSRCQVTNCKVMSHIDQRQYLLRLRQQNLRHLVCDMCRTDEKSRFDLAA